MGQQSNGTPNANTSVAAKVQLLITLALHTSSYY
jgi:hypothetical protein